MEKIENKTFGEERALYGLKKVNVINCKFQGIEDGESALKECTDIKIENTIFDLRYPLWHNNKVQINNSDFTVNCRAAIWYTKNIKCLETNISGVKVFRECHNIKINSCNIDSIENFWRCHKIELNNSSVKGEYAFFQSDNLSIKSLDFKGKYSFQYVKNMSINSSNLDTKDAFWHSKNVVVKDSIIKGEYLGWYAENITFINCKIIGTQPLCYVKKLKMINCEMIDTDLAFENSEVEADITNTIISIKNPIKGYIKAFDIEEIITNKYRLPIGPVTIETSKIKQTI